MRPVAIDRAQRVQHHRVEHRVVRRELDGGARRLLRAPDVRGLEEGRPGAVAAARAGDRPVGPDEGGEDVARVPLDECAQHARAGLPAGRQPDREALERAESGRQRDSRLLGGEPGAVDQLAPREARGLPRRLQRLADADGADGQDGDGEQHRHPHVQADAGDVPPRAAARGRAQEARLVAAAGPGPGASGSGPASSPSSSRISSMRLRARLTRLLMVPAETLQTSAASS